MLAPLLGLLLATAPPQGPRSCANLEQAIQAAGGKSPIVLWCAQVVGLRDRLDFIVLESLCLGSDPAKTLLDGLPLVKLDPSKGPGKDWKLPTAGFAVLDPAGKEVRARVPLSKEPAQTLTVLAKALERVVPGNLPAGIADKLESWAKLVARIEAAARAGDEAGVEELLRKGKDLLPHPLPDRLLERRVRRLQKADAWLEALPEPRPVRDLVVVVEDRAGFVAALRGWAEGPIHPILFRDAYWLPRFLAAYQPKELRYLPGGGATAPTRDAMLAAVAEAKGPADQPAAPGLVLAGDADPHCEAALALAAGHRQALVLDFEATPHDKVLDVAGLEALRKALRARIDALGLQAYDLFDACDLVTLAVELPYRWREEGGIDTGPLSVDDALCRDADELRWAYTGRLVGDRDQALYQAMCALFLRPGEGFLFSRYSTKGEPWSRYDTAKAREVLGEEFPCEDIGPPDASLETWRERFGFERNLAGLVHVNSSGGARAWSTVSGQGDSDDVPETVPAIVSYVHSFSAADPWDIDTIAGRWLRNGAYAYFGSMHEPFLDAFVPIDRVWKRSLDDGMPLAMAQASFAGEGRWRPWKLCFVGDPLLVLDLREQKKVADGKGVPDGALTVKEALRKLPSRRRGLAKDLCELELMVCEPGGDRFDRELRSLLDRVARKPKDLDDEERRSLADLCALHLEGAIPQKDLAKDLGRMREAGLASRELGYRLSYFGKLHRSQVDDSDDYRALLFAQPWSGWQRKLLEKRWPEAGKKE